MKKIFPCQETCRCSPTCARSTSTTPSWPTATTTAGSPWCWPIGCRCSTTPAASRCATWPASSTWKASSTALPPPLPPVASFEFALAQDWSVLASVAPGGGPDVQVLGNAQLGNVVLPAAAGLQGQRPPRCGGCGLRGGRRGAGEAGGLHRRRGQDGSSPRSASSGARPPSKVAAVALDPDAKRLVRDTMAQGFRLPDRGLCDREGAALPGAGALVVHHQRRRHLRER